MKQTENLNLSLPEDGDTFDIDDFNGNFERIDKAVSDLSGDGNGGIFVTDEILNARLGGLTLAKITQSDYDSLESPDENTVYIITEGENDTE
jgi:hypothetical protein